MSNQFTSSIQNFSLNYLDEVYQKLKMLLDHLRNDLNNLSSQFNIDGKDWAKKSLDTQISVFADFSTILDDNLEKFSNFLSNQDKLLAQMNIEAELQTSNESSPLLAFIVSVNNNFISFKKQLISKLEETKTSYKTQLEKVNTEVAGFKKNSEEKINSITMNYLTHLEQNTANFREIINTTVNNNKASIETFTAKLNTGFQNLEKTRKDSLVTIAENMKKQQDIALQTQNEAKQKLQEGILTPFNTQFEDIKRIRNKFFSDITKAVDNHYKAIETKMTGIITSFKNSYNNFTEKTQAKTDEATKAANKDLDSFIKNEQQLVTTHLNDLRKPIPAIQTNTDKQITDINTRLDTELGLLDSVITTHIANTQKSLEVIQKLFITDLTADLTALVQSTDEENPKVSKLDLLKKIQENIAKKQLLAEKEIKNSSTELNSKILDPFKKQLDDLKTKRTNLKDYLAKASSEYFTNVNKHLGDLDTSLKTKIDDLNKKLFKSIENTSTKLKGEYKSFINEQYNITDDYFKDEKKNLSVYKKDGIQLIKDINKIFTPELKRLETSVKTFTSSAFSLLNSLDSVIITGIPDDLRSNIARTNDELTKNSSEAQKQLQEYKTSYLGFLSTMEQTLQSSNDSNKSQHQVEINNLKDESQKSLDEETASVLSFNINIHSYSNKNAQTEHDEFQVLLSSSLNTIQSSLLDATHEQQTILANSMEKKKNDFENQNKTIQDRYGTISTTLDKYISDFNNATQQQVTSHETEISGFHDETKTKVKNETNEINKKHLTEVATTIIKHTTDYTDHHKNLQTIAHSFLQLIENDSILLADMIKNDGTNRMQQNKTLLLEKTNYVRTVHDHFVSSVNNTNTTATQLKDGLIASVGDHYTKLITGNERFTTDFQITVKKGLEILTTKITIMEDFERLVNGYTYPKVTSLPVIGRGSALHTIDHYLGDFKASVTLLIPNPNDIPVELIAKTKRPKRVTVASVFNLDDPREKQMVAKLLEQDNVTVRQLSPGHGPDTGYPQYLSADRDAEEIFFGSYDLENKAEFAGMVSQNRHYIEFIGRVITSDYLSKAKKIEKV